jgi:hypothetical protein
VLNPAAAPPAMVHKAKATYALCSARSSRPTYPHSVPAAEVTMTASSMPAVIMLPPATTMALI